MKDDYPLATKSDIQTILKDYSVEITPKGVHEIDDFARWLKPQTQVYITFLPGTSVEHTLNAAAILKRQGMRPVPHIAMRSIESEPQLRRVLARLESLEIRDVLLIAGAIKQAKGPYYSVPRMLQEGILDEYDFSGVAFAGHPEGSPDISADDMSYSERFKQDYARAHPRNYWLVSQFCFAAEPVITWQQQLLARDIHFPLRVGIAGLATIATLLKHAKACGIGPSVTYLLKNSRGFRHVMTTSTPDGIIAQLAAYCASNPKHKIEGLHFYPLGGFMRTIRWLDAIEAGHFDMTEDGFYVE